MNNRLFFNKKTIEDVIYTEGRGIHSGSLSKIRLLPADINTGIVFINKKYGMKSPIKVSPESVVNTNYAITLGNGKWYIKTVEHLLSFFYIYGITDIIVEIDGYEIPIYDGSISPMINIFDEKKFYIFEELNEPIKIINPIWIIDGDKFIIVLPSDIPRISYTISYDHPVLKMQYAHFPLTRDVIKDEIAPARTYGFLRDIEFLRSNYLAMGGNLENTVVISEDSYLNDLRFENECVRHKILDFIGDISLIGKPVIGYFIVCKSGHTFNLEFIKKIKDIYSKIDIGSKHYFQRIAKRKV